MVEPFLYKEQVQKILFKIVFLRIIRQRTMVDQFTSKGCRAMYEIVNLLLFITPIFLRYLKYFFRMFNLSVM